MTVIRRRLIAGLVGVMSGGAAAWMFLAAAFSTENNGEFHVGDRLDWTQILPICLIPFVAIGLIAGVVVNAVLWVPLPDFIDPARPRNTK